MRTDRWGLLGHPPRVLCVGVYIVDVLGRAIDELPRGQRSLLIDEIAMTVAGTAGAVSVNLARMGAEVRAVGTVGDDPLGGFLRTRLADEGVDATGLRIVASPQTSATILPIDSAGQRPAFHVIGANGRLGPEDVESLDLDAVDVLHLGGVTALPRLDGEPSRRLLERARRAGVMTSMDMLGVKRPDAADLVRGYLPFVDLFTPNDAEACLLTGEDDPVAAAQVLVAWGARTVVVTCGGDGTVVGDVHGVRRIPALQTEVVDTTGCGDALTSGTIIGIHRGWAVDDAVRLGMAAATLTAEGLGSDAGFENLDDVDRVLGTRPVAEKERADG